MVKKNSAYAYTGNIQMRRWDTITPILESRNVCAYACFIGMTHWHIKIMLMHTYWYYTNETLRHLYTSIPGWKTCT